MNLPEVERLVAELLATGEMNDDTSADLERILSEARAGQSYPDDLDYLAALHARVLSPDRPLTEPDARSEETVVTLKLEIERLRAELDEARRTIADLEGRMQAGA